MVRLGDSCARPHRSCVSGRRADLDGIKDKLLAAVLARLRALGTLRHAVLGQEPTHHPGPALILTVNALLRTHTLVILMKKDPQF